MNNGLAVCFSVNPYQISLISLAKILAQWETKFQILVSIVQLGYTSEISDVKQTRNIETREITIIYENYITVNNIFTVSDELETVF